MKRLLATIAILAWLAAAASAQSLQTLLQRLDAAVSGKEAYNRNKEERIDAIRSSLPGISPDDRYGVYDALYREYAKYDLDSALKYATLKAGIAAGGSNDLDISLLQLADIYTNAGLYQEAEETAARVSDRERAVYYHTMHTLYSAMAATAGFSERADAYSLLKEQYRDSLIQSLRAGDLGYVYASAEKLNEEGRWDEAIQLLTKYYNDPVTKESDKAILDYCMAVAYKGLGNREQAEWHYAASAIADITTPIKEYRSLQELSYMLYEDGDLTRAYRYITCAMDDVQGSKTLIRALEFTPFFSTIGDAYEKGIRHRNRVQRSLVLTLSALLVLLALAALLMLRQRRATIAANRKLKEANDQLVNISKQLQETGYLKEEYLYQYMEQAAGSMDKVNAYRRRMLQTYNKFGAERLVQELETAFDVDKDLRSFYNNFDETFLHIFPTFVSDVNNLLREDQQLVPKPGRLMNTELRILALLRLGVTDNVKMAHFLRTSLSTIYNYRSKLRNAAKGDPALFEENIARIGEVKLD